MPDGVVERTRQSDLQPLVANGVPVYRMYGQIRVELLRTLSQAHLDLFAEPNPDPTTGDIQWFAPHPGAIVRLADCSEDDRADAEFHLARLVDEISHHIDQLNQSNDDDERAMANVLAMAIEIPDESHIFTVGGQPVIAGWGHVPRGPALLRRQLVALVKRVLTINPKPEEPPPLPEQPPEPAPPTPPPTTAEEKPADEPAQPAAAPFVAADTGRIYAPIQIVNEVAGPTRLFRLNWILWALLAALLIAIGYLLLRYCALGWPYAIGNRLIANYCVADIQPQRTDDLLTHLIDLKQALAEKQRRLCALPSPTPTPIRTPTPIPTPTHTPTPTPTPTATPNSADRVLDRGGRIGAVNVILTWNSEDDLDLDVICPTGEQIYFSDKTKCGGTLDIDANSGSNPMTSPVENITWPQGAAPPGVYKVEVNPYTRRSSTGPVEYKVELRINGEVKEEYTRHFDPGQGKMSVFQFTLPYAGRQQ